MKSVVRWIVGRAGLYLLLVAALAFGPILMRALAGADLRNELMSPQAAVVRFGALRDETAAAFARRRVALAGAPAWAVEARLQQARAELSQVQAELARGQGWFASIRPRLVLERKRLELRRSALQGEIQLLANAREGHRIGAELQRAAAQANLTVAAAKARCDRANADVRAFNARLPVERSVRNALSQEPRRLTDNAERQCGAYRQERAAAEQQQRVLRARLAEAQRAYAEAGRETEAAISRAAIDVVGSVRGLLVQAALLLAGILVTPYLIRLLFYYMLAPMASRRPAVRLRLPGSVPSTPLVSAPPSATSAALTLRPGERLLVRQGFLQTTSSAGAKRTQALLDWRHPLSSLASGLVFLTRIEGAGETTTVSAVKDPFAEVTVLDLPAGAACVLQPRALAAAAQPSGAPLRISSHWRLGSLHAWLTLQLRYLMFHGPARLVIKGGRGVRVERAERGRVFGQDQLVGFSADLSYSVTRTETFWPYFLGLESLLKDKVEAGDGVLILEEAPAAARRRGRPPRGLEGAFDVLLKAVGI